MDEDRKGGDKAVCDYIFEPEDVQLAANDDKEFISQKDLAQRVIEGDFAAFKRHAKSSVHFWRHLAAHNKVNVIGALYDYCSGNIDMHFEEEPLKYFHQGDIDALQCVQILKAIEQRRGLCRDYFLSDAGSKHLGLAIQQGNSAYQIVRFLCDKEIRFHYRSALNYAFNANADLIVRLLAEKG